MTTILGVAELDAAPAHHRKDEDNGENENDDAQSDVHGLLLVLKRLGRRMSNPGDAETS
jgi:hypothetical protein